MYHHYLQHQYLIQEFMQEVAVVVEELQHQEEDTLQEQEGLVEEEQDQVQQLQEFQEQLIQVVAVEVEEQMFVHHHQQYQEVQVVQV